MVCVIEVSAKIVKALLRLCCWRWSRTLPYHCTVQTISPFACTTGWERPWTSAIGREYGDCCKCHFQNHWEHPVDETGPSYFHAKWVTGSNSAALSARDYAAGLFAAAFGLALWEWFQRLVRPRIRCAALKVFQLSHRDKRHQRCTEHRYLEPKSRGKPIDANTK